MRQRYIASPWLVKGKNEMKEESNATFFFFLTLRSSFLKKFQLQSGNVKDEEDGLKKTFPNEQA